MSAAPVVIGVLRTRVAPLAVRWNAMLPREQRLVRMAAAFVAVAVVWLVAVAPAVRTLRVADTQRRTLEAELQAMQNLRAQAVLLQSQPTVSRSDALRALDTSVKQTLATTGQLSIVGDRATVTLRGTPAAALAQWLAQVRINARALPSEARLTRSAPVVAPSPGPVTGVPNLTAPPEPVWSGTLVLSLPAQ